MLKALYKFDPNQLAHKFFEQIKKQWPGYRIKDYRFVGPNMIAIYLSI